MNINLVFIDDCKFFNLLEPLIVVDVACHTS